MQLEWKLEGVDEFARKLDNLETVTARRRVFTSALRRGLAVIRNRARTNARRYSLRGHLARSIKTKAKVYPSGYAFGIVGASYRVTADQRNPGNYSHLVEFGTRAHHKFSRRRAFRSTGPPVQWWYYDERQSRWRVFPRGVHPGSRPKPFLIPAAQTEIRRAQLEFAAQFTKMYRQKLIAGL